MKERMGKSSFFRFLVFFLIFSTACPLPAYELAQLNSTERNSVFPFTPQQNNNSGSNSQVEDRRGGVNSNPAASVNLVLERPIDSKKYIVGPGDTFVLNIWGAENQSVYLNVTPEGNLFIPEVGYLNVTGIPLSEVRNKIKEAASYYLGGTNFDISLIKPRIFQLHVVGEVGHPGVYSASASERLSEVIERAGGIRYKGSNRAIQIRRKDKPTLFADLFSFDYFGSIEGNPYVLDNDIIFVPLASSIITIKGAINRPGSYELARNRSLDEAIRLARGTTNRVDPTQTIEVTHFKKGQDPQAYAVSFAEAKHFQLQDGDVIDIPSVEDSQKMIRVRGAILGVNASQAPIQAALPELLGQEQEGISSGSLHALSKEKESEKQVLLPYVQDATVLDIIRDAGGLAPWADFHNAYILRNKAEFPNSPENTKPPSSQNLANENLGQVRGGPRYARYSSQKKTGANTPTLAEDDGFQQIRVDLYQLVIQKNYQADVTIQPGDELVIPRAEDNVYVAGAIQRPGAFPYNPGYSPMDYIGRAGGFSPLAKKGAVAVITHNSKAYKLKQTRNLRAGDTIFVPSKTFRAGDWIQLFFSVTALGFASVTFATR